MKPGEVKLIPRALAQLLARVVREREAWGGASGVFTAEERIQLKEFADVELSESGCAACERGEATITPPASSIVGSHAVHTPSGNVCTRKP